MNPAPAPWQRSFAAFAGPGIHRPSAMMRVTGSEARAILARLHALDWSAPAWIGADQHAAYLVRNATQTSSTALYCHGAIVGFYSDSYLWIAPPHRGRGLSTQLILAAANQRGGTILPPGVVFQGYTPAGVTAHRSAHAHAVLTALAAGLPVPAEVLEEFRRNDGQLPGHTGPLACLR